MQSDGVMPAVGGVSPRVGSAFRSSALEIERFRGSGVGLVSGNFPLDLDLCGAICGDLSAEVNNVRPAAYNRGSYIGIGSNIRNNGCRRRCDRYTGQVPCRSNYARRHPAEAAGVMRIADIPPTRVIVPTCDLGDLPERDGTRDRITDIRSGPAIHGCGDRGNLRHARCRHKG